MDKSVSTLILYSDDNEEVIAKAIKQVMELVDIQSDLSNYDQITNPPPEIKRYDFETGNEWLLNSSAPNKSGNEIKQFFSFKRYVFVILTEQSAAFALRVLTLRGAIDLLKDKYVVFVDPQKHISDLGIVDISEFINEKNKIDKNLESLIVKNIISGEKIKKLFKEFMSLVSHDARR